MIKQEKGNIQLKGAVAELLSDFSLIVRGLKDAFTEDGDFTEKEVKEMLTHALEVGFKTEKEIAQRTEEIRKELEESDEEDFEEFLKELFGIEEVSEDWFKIWCETNAERDAVIAILEKKGILWAECQKPSEYDGLENAPMGFIVEDCLYQTTIERIEDFDELEYRNLKLADLVKEMECDE